MPDVLRIIARLNVGGPARHVLRIAQPLAERGYRSTLVTGTPEAGEGDLVEEARVAGLRVLVLPGLTRAPRLRADLSVLSALRRLIAAEQPDIVHTHTAKAGALGRLAAPRRGGPALVHTFHGHVLDGYFGPLRSAGAAALERRLARRSARLVAVCGAVRDELVQRHRIAPAEQFAIVPTGFDPERCAPQPAAGAALRAELGLRPEDVLVLAVARCAAIKNLPLLLDAAALAHARVPSLRLLFVGDGPDAPALDRRLARLSFAQRLSPRRELGALYAAADIVALSSRREGCPQVLVEALFAGCPIVSTAVGGVPELLDHGRRGRLVPEGCVESFAAALAELAGRPDARARLSAAARDSDLSAHRPAAVGAALAAVYDEVLASGRRSGQTAAACSSSS